MAYGQKAVKGYDLLLSAARPVLQFGTSMEAGAAFKL